MVLDKYTQNVYNNIVKRIIYYIYGGNNMTKRLIQHGNSVALVIDKPIMELLNINNETTFELSTDGKNLILSPQTEVSNENDIIASLAKINKKYGKILKRLGE
jgi:antitoxin component of MazEF toxin-antitoxin module